jgi:uncharacterized protein YpmS
MKQLKLIPLIIFVLVLSSLACNLSFGRQATPEPLIPLASEEEESVGGSAEETIQGEETGGMMVLEVSEAQLTSLLVGELEKRIGDQITNFQAYLRDGQIQIFGDIDSQGITAPVKVIVDVSVDPAGRPNLHVISSSIGPFPVPGELISEVEVLINKAFQDKVQSMAPNLHIQSIVIENGKMTIYGTK